MLTLAEVRRKTLDKLSESGLTKPDAERLGVKATITPPSAIPLKAGGFLLPYYDITGQPTEFFRYRLLEPPARNGFAALAQHKTIRYTQPAGLAPRVYFSRLMNWTEYLKAKVGAERVLFITEGENKASCGCKYGFPTIGLGGVWNFKSKKDNFVADLEQIDWAGAAAYITYDSDARTNYQVLAAENALARELLDRGANVFVVRIPALAEGLKTGMDDYLVARGADAFTELVTKAEPWLRSRILHELNEEVVFVHDPGLVLELNSLQRMSPATFTNSIYANRIWEDFVTVNGKTKVTKKRAAAEWLLWPYRGEVPRATYKPGARRITEEEGELNLWPGWGVTSERSGDVSLWKELIRYLFTGAQPEHKKWFEQWLAYPIQHPGAKLFSTVVMWGLKHGTGKTLVGHTMSKLYGKNFAEIEDRDLQGTFNEWAENKQFVMGDEITGGDKRSSSDRMKSIITRNSIRINAKFIPTYTVPDCINYYFTSNHPDSFFLDDNDRRYFIHEVLATVPLSDDFYKKYDVWYKSDAVGALFYYLMHVDLTGFNPAAHAPATQSKKEMIETGRSDVGAWVAVLRDLPDSVLRVNIGSPAIPWRLWSTEALHRLYDPEGRSKVTKPGLGRELSRAGFRKVNKGEPIWTANDGAMRLWAIRGEAELMKMDNRQLGELYTGERKSMAKKEKFV